MCSLDRWQVSSLCLSKWLVLLTHVGPLGKIPNGGRGWEGFSPDPYLTGIAMQQTISGMQVGYLISTRQVRLANGNIECGVQACAKHYIGNEQEKNRETINSNIDDRTTHELYLWPFADAVKANVASVMCSYNQVIGLRLTIDGA